MEADYFSYTFSCVKIQLTKKPIGKFAKILCRSLSICNDLACYYLLFAFGIFHMLYMEQMWKK